jgi:hypothetical protein
MASKRKKKGHSNKVADGGRTTPRASRTREPVRAQIPRPRVTEYNVVTAVPVFPHGDAGEPSGSPGRYDVLFVLGVPGVSGVATALDFDAIAAGGDSLLEGSGLQIDLATPDGSASNMARIVPNKQGRLAQVRLTITAESFAAAEKEAHDEVMPVLSRIAFEADTALEVTAVLMTEEATQIRSVGATVIGSVQPAPELEGLMTEELRPFLAAYREGLNSNSPLYQSLSFYKVIEGVATFAVKRARSVSRGSQSTADDPLTGTIPVDLSELPETTEWARAAFAPYLGKSFSDIKDSVSDTIRNAVAHLTPGRDVRVADYLADIHACREVLPILRYVARSLIREELAQLATSATPNKP